VAATLSPEEVKALMGAIQDGRVQTEGGRGPRGPVASYDVTSQDRIIRGQMPTLDSINEQIASQLAIGLTGRTRLSLRCAARAATLLKFADLTPLLAPPATVCVVGLGAAHGFALLLLEPGVAEALLAAAFGDRRVRSPEEQGEGRHDFTAVEQVVLRRLLSILTDAMGTAWQAVLPFQPEVLRIEMDPRMAHIAPPSDVGIVASFELSGGIEGRLQLVVPYAAVEPAKGKLAAPRQLAQRGDGRIQELLVREVEQVEVDVRGLLGCATMPFAKILELQPGDLLLLDSDEGSPVPIFVEGRKKMLGRPSVFGGALALVVESPVRDLPPPLPASSALALPRSESR